MQTIWFRVDPSRFQFEAQCNLSNISSTFIASTIIISVISSMNRPNHELLENFIAADSRVVNCISFIAQIIKLKFPQMIYRNSINAHVSALKWQIFFFGFVINLFVKVFEFIRF